MFNEELNNVKKELSSKVTNMMPHLPKYAGSAHWARALKRRIDRPMEVCSIFLILKNYPESCMLSSYARTYGVVVVIL